MRKTHLLVLLVKSPQYFLYNTESQFLYWNIHTIFNYHLNFFLMKITRPINFLQCTPNFLQCMWIYCIPFLKYTGVVSNRLWFNNNNNNKIQTHNNIRLPTVWEDLENSARVIWTNVMIHVMILCMYGAFVCFLELNSFCSPHGKEQPQYLLNQKSIFELLKYFCMKMEKQGHIMLFASAWSRRVAGWIWLSFSLLIGFGQVYINAFGRCFYPKCVHAICFPWRV